MTLPGQATQLLRRLSDGDLGAADELAPILHEELHRLAARAMAGARAGHTLQPTALLNEAWMRLIEVDGPAWDGRSHFLGVAARAMRSVLVDHARRRGAQKRGGGGERIDLDAAVLAFEERASDLLALEEALQELSAVDPDLVRVVKMRFFGGLSHPEAAEVMGTSLRSVERAWSTARAWLYQRIAGPEERGR